MGIHLTWEYGRKLTAISGSGLEVSYTYSVDGKRMSKTVNGVTTDFIYSGDTLAGFKRGSDTLMWLYGADGDYLGFTLNGAEYYYVKNMQGDIVAIADENRNIVVVYTYNDYGKLESTSGTLAGTVGALNPIRYRGYYYDDETGFYYTDTRYYDPQTARFINADDESLIIATPMSLTDKNLYAYCDNNPISRADRGGKFWNTIIGTVTGAIIGGVNAALTGSSIKAGIVSGAVSGAISGAALDIAVATGGIGVMAFAVIGGAGGGAIGSIISQTMNNQPVDPLAVLTDAVIGGIAGFMSYGSALATGATPLRETLKQPMKEVAVQAVKDTASTTAISSWGAGSSSGCSYIRTSTSAGKTTCAGVDRRERASVRRSEYYNSYRYRRGLQR